MARCNEQAFEKSFKKVRMISLMVWNMSALHHSANCYYNEAKFDRELDQLRKSCKNCFIVSEVISFDCSVFLFYCGAKNIAQNVFIFAQNVASSSLSHAWILYLEMMRKDIICVFPMQLNGDLIHIRCKLIANIVK